MTVVTDVTGLHNEKGPGNGQGFHNRVRAGRLG